MKKEIGHFAPKAFLIRQLIILPMAMLFGGLKDYIDWFANGAIHVRSDFALMLAYTYIYISLIWNGNMLAGLGLEKLFKTDVHIRRYLIFWSAIAVILPVVNHVLCNQLVFPALFQRPRDLNPRDNYMFLVLSIVVTLFINSIYAARDFFDKWQHTVEEKEALKRKSISAEFETLKNQVNPHFLFNSLNTLTALIEDDKERAVDFVQQLAQVYRYILQNNMSETQSLAGELRFTESFIFLARTRFGQNLKVIERIDETVRNSDYRIPALSLQMLVENAIKHNIISKEQPLTIEIYNEGTSMLCVRNNLQPKAEVEPSNKIGLNNIRSRYGYLTDKPVVVDANGHFFKVCLPLLQPNETLQ